MLSYKLNARRGFTPAAVAPLMRYLPNMCLRHHRKAQGRYGGTGSLHSYQPPEFHINAKGILQSQKKDTLS